ncbi:MAG: [protein-PII] uridylyltransferase [Burkholderiales bacterium]|jgi:[protein-PII] uridylyltransferase|nr:[protein-PII] uridylyltransferase [Burkholderiales bacterium]
MAVRIRRSSALWFTSDALVVIRKRLDEERTILNNIFLAKHNTAVFLRQSAHCVDRALRRLWRELPTTLTRNGVLLAIGGYGRNTLFPHSDIDTVIVLGKTPTDTEKSALVALETALWDLGLRVGHNVRTLDEFEEFVQWDITTQTALLEYRYLGGSRICFQYFEQALKRRLDFPSFYKSKRFEQEQRYLRYRDALYNLEPNLKESPGGLRDVHLVRWLIRAASLAGIQSETDGNVWLTTDEARILRQQEHYLNHLRIHLHLLAGRAEERLLFDHQNALAEVLGIPEKLQQHHGEALMQRYYRAAQKIRRLNLLFMQVIAEHLYPLSQSKTLDDVFTQRGASLDVHDSSAFSRNPSAIFDVFLHWQRQPEISDLSANTLRALNHARAYINDVFRRDPRNQRKFITFFRGGRAVTHGTRIMNLYGLLGAYLPTFGQIVGRMQHDLFHVYTVDEHILMTIRNLRRFSLDAHAHEYPLCSRLMMDFASKEILYFAALFHDIAKGRGGDHSLKGAEIARRFARKCGFAKEDVTLIAWLVKAHLWLSLTAQKQDISNPEIIHTFARKVKTERRLVALYLLTVADIRATSPEVWNPWKAQLLESLFFATHARLHQRSDYDTIEKKQRLARERLDTLVERDAEIPLWKTLDIAYFQRHSVDEMVWHVSALHACLTTQTPLVDIRRLPQKAGLQFLVYLPDRSKLFAQLCIFFGGHQLNILEARIHTTQHGYALDTFTVYTRDSRFLENEDNVLADLEKDLRTFLCQPLSALPALGKPSRRSRHFPLFPQIRISSGDVNIGYVLEVVAGDRTGLLAHVAAVLVDAEVNVKNARINTMGERVEDIFVIEGETLHSAENRAVLELRLQELLHVS